VLLATQIHSAAILVLPVYWLVNYKFSRRVLLLPIVIGMFLAMIHWADIFIGFLGRFGLVPQGVKEYVGISSLDYNLGILNPVTIKQILLCVFCIYYVESLTKLNRYFYPLLVMYILSTAWILAFSSFAILAARVATFFSVGEIILLPIIVLKFRQQKLVLASILLLGCAMLVLNLAFKNMWPPYHTIFS
jgi:hypothetical protein